MEMTTIALDKELKQRISEFGNKGETFSDILAKLVKSAEQRLFQDVLMSEQGCVTIEEAIKEAEKKWPK
jgi:predicted CopG family antitoxin